jgi:hypothetical protein
MKEMGKNFPTYAEFSKKLNEGSPTSKVRNRLKVEASINEAVVNSWAAAKKQYAKSIDYADGAASLAKELGSAINADITDDAWDDILGGDSDHQVDVDDTFDLKYLFKNYPKLKANADYTWVEFEVYCLCYSKKNNAVGAIGWNPYEGNLQVYVIAGKNGWKTMETMDDDE